MKNRKTAKETVTTGSNKMVQKRSVHKKGYAKQCAMLAFFVAVNVISVTMPAYATGTSIVTSGMKNLQDIVAAFVSAVGSIIVLWGLFEFGNALQTNDGMMQSAAFKRIGGGLIMTIGPQLLSLLVQG